MSPAQRSLSGILLTLSSKKVLIGDGDVDGTQMALMRDGALSSCLLLSLDDGEKMTEL